MKKNKKIYSYWIIITVFITWACSNDDVGIISAKSEGYFIVNEGAYNKGTTSISFYDRETKTITNNVFAAANGRPLGDQTQSMTIFNGQGYILVQNSAKIEVININTFESIASIDEGLPGPRHFAGVSTQKGYVSDWGKDGVTGTVKVIDLEKNQVTKTIAAGQGTNQMLLLGDRLFVTNSGGLGRDNTIKVINTDTDEIEQTIEVADNPNSLRADTDGNIWIASSGHTSFDPMTFEIIPGESTPAAIIKLDAKGKELLRLSYDKVGFSQSASCLSIDPSGETLYYLYEGKIYSMAFDATALPEKPFAAKDYYGLSIDPFDQTVIGFEAPTFTSNGNMDIYSGSGELLSTYIVGIGPNSAAFK